MTPLIEFLRDPQAADGLNIVIELLMAITLVSVRIQAFLYLSPFFNRMAMMRIVRLGFILALSIILVPQTYETIQDTPDFQKKFLALVIKEFVIGLVCGAVMWMPVRGLELTGVILDTQRGNMQALTQEPVLQAQTTPTAVFLLQMFSGYFFASGGFRLVETTLFKSAEIWAFTDPFPEWDEETLFLLVELTGILLFSAVAFALPIAGLMILADIVIAFIARSAPTLNALTFGMPVKSFILMIMLFFYMEIAYPKLIHELSNALQHIENIAQ